MMMNYMWDYLRENATVTEVPQDLYDVCYDFQDFSADLQAYQLGMTKEEMMTSFSISEDTLDGYATSMAEEILIAQAVAEKENIRWMTVICLRRMEIIWTPIWRHMEPAM